MCNNLAKRNLVFSHGTKGKKWRWERPKSAGRGRRDSRGMDRSLVSVPEGSAAAAPRWSMSPLSAIWTMSRCLGATPLTLSLSFTSLSTPLFRSPPHCLLERHSRHSPAKWTLYERKGCEPILIYYSSSNGGRQETRMRVRELAGRENGGRWEPRWDFPSSREKVYTIGSPLSFPRRELSKQWGWKFPRRASKAIHQRRLLLVPFARIVQIMDN